jgi:hypothetical protein
LIYPADNKKHWEAAFTGYLSFTNEVYKNIYDELKKYHHYDIALKTRFNGKNVNQRLIQHICIGYLNDWEKLEDENSLISTLLNRNEPSEYDEVITYIWSQRDKVPPDVKDRVKSLWRKIIHLIEKHSDDPSIHSILSNISKWLTLINAIDSEVASWLKLSVKYIEKSYNSSFLIEYLRHFVKDQPSLVADVYISMIEDGFIPDFRAEDIRAIVEELFVLNENKKAIRICNIYLNNGSELLRDIYIKYTTDED